MRVLSWNYRGVGSKWTIRYLREIWHKHKPDFLFLSETKQDSLLRYLTGFLRILSCIIMLSILSGGISGNERKKGLHRIVFMVIILPTDNKMLVIERFVQMLVLLVLLDKVTFVLESYYQNGEEWLGWGTCKRKHISLCWFGSVNIFRLQVQSNIRALVFNCRFFWLFGRLWFSGCRIHLAGLTTMQMPQVWFRERWKQYFIKYSRSVFFGKGVTDLFMGTACVLIIRRWFSWNSGLDGFLGGIGPESSRSYEQYKRFYL